MTGFVHIKLPGVCYRLTWIVYPDRWDGVKTSLYVELYKSVKLYRDNARESAIEFIIHSNMNVI